VSEGGRIHITKRAEVATSHRCAQPHWDDRQNDAVYGLEARPHGHNYLVEATVSGPLDPRTGMVTNIKDVKAALGEVLADYDHHDLNLDHPDFAGVVPTSERVLDRVFAALAARFERSGQGRLERVRLFESEDVYYEAHHPQSALAPAKRKDAMLVTRRYTFSAAHRLHSPHLTEAENRETFLDCNNPNGHGHNYTLEVTVKGEVDPATGLAANHAHLDRAVREGIVDRYNYRNLNDDVPEFASEVTTSENIVKVVWDILEKRLGEGILYRVRLAETRDNYFEYYG